MWPSIDTLEGVVDSGSQITQRAAARVATTHFATGNEWFFEGPEGQESVRTRSAFRCDNGDICRMVTLAGGGISLQPSFMVADDLTKGDLVEVLPGYSSVELRLCSLSKSQTCGAEGARPE